MPRGMRVVAKPRKRGMLEQEQNGVYYYDRTPKMDVEFFRQVNSRKAAIED